ncbi:hypothetical protein HJG60_010897 [Phyllostomus discolor]|uniref:L1 transposable element RRM domain-containing protein n=1 Tax=Phyllostomus discolor TaxID=89673 RepID=A0A834AET1_9CHIR|nr:hypothetical protein HJG60_010897 [Phyllostomus discolor]
MHQKVLVCFLSPFLSLKLINILKRGLGISGTSLTFQHPNHRVPEGKKEEQETEKLFVKIMKENFPNLEKEIDFQKVQEAQRVLNNLDPRKHTPRHIIITLPKIKDKERVLKTAREKQRVTFKGVPIRLS